ADSIGPAHPVHAVDLSRFKSPPLVEAFTKGRAPAKKEVQMDKTQVATRIQAANKPILDVLAALKPAAPEAKTAAVETPEQIEARITKARDDYEAEINALCEDFGKPEAAAAFIKDKKSPADVRAALRLTKASKGRATPNAALRN